MEYKVSNNYFKAYNESSSYEWFPIAYFNNNINSLRIWSDDKMSQENFGTINTPTGTGKTTIVFLDIIRRIDEAVRHNKPLIINLCSPYIKLNQQIAYDSLFVLTEMYFNKTSPKYIGDVSKIRFYVNSSDTKANNVFKILRYYNEQNFHEFKGGKNSEFIKDVKNDAAIIYVVYTCYYSMNDFISNIKAVKNITTNVVSYLDESHTISDDPTADMETCKKFRKSFSIKKLLDVSKSGCYAISATPDEDIVDMLNARSEYHKNMFGHEKYFIYMSAYDAVSKGLIVAPYMDLVYTKAKELNNKHIENIYNNCRTINDKIKYHKILFTCPVGGCAGDKNDNGMNPKKIAKVYDAICKTYKKKIAEGKLGIFITSADTGMKSYIKSGDAVINKTYNTMKDFTDEIDKSEHDCIVLHIKQMIAGIDVSSLTQVVMYTNDVNDNNIQDIIQTCGRCLRSAKGERGMETAKRTKQFGVCTFIINENRIDDVTIRLEDIFWNYYFSGIPVNIRKTYDYIVGIKKPKYELKENKWNPVVDTEFKQQALQVSFDEYVELHKKRLLSCYKTIDEIMKYDSHIQHLYTKKYENTAFVYSDNMITEMRDILKSKLNLK